MNKTDLQALNLSGTFCHKTGIRPPYLSNSSTTDYIWELSDQMPSALTTMILVQSSTALGDTTTKDTVIANHVNK